MSKSENLVVNEKAEDLRLIDTDFHLQIPTDFLYPYVDDTVVQKKLEENGPPPRGGPVNSAYSVDPDSGIMGNVDGAAAMGRAYSSDEIKEVMEEMAFNEVLVSPGTHLPFTRTIYPKVSNHLVRAYNDYIMDEVVNTNQGIYAMVVVPHWDTEFAVEELNRLGGEEGIIGAANWITTDRLWGNLDYDPIYDALTSLDLPLFLHVNGHTTPHSPDLVRQDMRTLTEMLMGNYAWSVVANTLNMIFTGVFEKFPDLDVVMQEAGVLWIPYVAWRTDEFYQSYPEDVKLAERLDNSGKEYLDKLPSEYLFDNFYVTSQPISLPNVKPRSHIQKLLDVCRAEDMLLYSSDWPHPTTDPADWLFNLGINEDLRNKIAYENTSEIVEGL